MSERGSDKYDSNPETQIIPATDRLKLIRQREQLILRSGKMGSKQLADDAAMSKECVLLLRDGAQGNQVGGVRIYLPEANDHLLLALFGNEDENAEIVRSINDSGYFSGERDNQEGKAIGEYYNVTMTDEPPATSTKIKTMSLRMGTSNRILALIRQALFG